MSLMRRRMMMTKAKREQIPRENLVFSKAGDKIADGVTKSNDGAAICGWGLLSLGGGVYVLYLCLVSMPQIDFNAVIASQYASNAWIRFADDDGTVHACSTTFWNPTYNTLEAGIAYINTINSNNLPILNEITGKAYDAGYGGGGGRYTSTDLALDLTRYYYGVI